MIQPPPTTPAVQVCKSKMDSCHKFLIKYGEIHEASEDFVQFKRHYCLVWGGLVLVFDNCNLAPIIHFMSSPFITRWLVGAIYGAKEGNTPICSSTTSITSTVSLSKNDKLSGDKGSRLNVITRFIGRKTVWFQCTLIRQLQKNSEMSIKLLDHFVLEHLQKLNQRNKYDVTLYDPCTCGT